MLTRPSSTKPLVFDVHEHPLPEAYAAGREWADQIRPGSQYREIDAAARQLFERDHDRDLFEAGAEDALDDVLLQASYNQSGIITKLTAKPSRGRQ